MTAGLWDEWAEMSVAHRDIHDPDVIAVLRLVQREAERGRLHGDGGLGGQGTPAALDPTSVPVARTLTA